MIWRLPNCDIKIIRENNLVAAKSSPRYFHKKMTLQPPNCDIKIVQENELMAARSSLHYPHEKTTWQPLGRLFATFERK